MLLMRILLLLLLELYSPHFMLHTPLTFSESVTSIVLKLLLQTSSTSPTHPKSMLNITSMEPHPYTPSFSKCFSSLIGLVGNRFIRLSHLATSNSLNMEILLTSTSLDWLETSNI
ncbi:hypothetical protein HanPI659440_Chr14g0569061 [Helianthus annuus]|nr:hypothetical protein HanPI659440_Chr14g0569061 [Helianthus annuus]